MRIVNVRFFLRFIIGLRALQLVAAAASSPIKRNHRAQSAVNGTAFRIERPMKNHPNPLPRPRRNLRIKKGALPGLQGIKKGNPNPQKKETRA